MMAAAIRETVRLTLNTDKQNEVASADHERMGDYANDLVSAVEEGDPETVAMLLRRQAQGAS